MKSVTLAIAAALSLLAFGAVQAAAPPPTDPQIADIAYTAGAIDIAAAKQALAKTHNPQVKAFAEEIKDRNDCAMLHFNLAQIM